MSKTTSPNQRTSSEIRFTRLTYNPIIVAIGRGKRPDQFAPTNEPKICPFCPGNESMTPTPEIYCIRDDNGGWLLRVVPNKFPTFRIEGKTTLPNEIDASTHSIPDAHGAHEVIIETPSHTETYAELSVSTLIHIIEACNIRIIDLYKDSDIRYVQVFKNHGPDAGASLPHPHTQVIGLPVIPPKLIERLRDTEQYETTNGRSIYNVHINRARTEGRIVAENESFVCLVPYEAKFPFEMSIIPIQPQANFRDSEPHFDKLASILFAAHRKLKTIFGYMPPYNSFIEEAPPKSYRNSDRFFRWRYRILPRVTKIAGFELATAMYVNPTAPEESARLLREAQT